MGKKRIINLHRTRGSEATVLTVEERSKHHQGVIMFQCRDQVNVTLEGKCVEQFACCCATEALFECSVGGKAQVASNLYNVELHQGGHVWSVWLLAG